MNLEQSVNIIKAKIESLHIEDPGIYKYWDELTDVLSEDEKATITYLSGLQDEQTINCVSSVFEDVSAKLQSKKFIDCLEVIELKFKNLELQYMVEAAKNAFDFNSEDEEHLNY